MNRTVSESSIQKRSGKRKAARENSKKSYSLKDKCRLLTVGDYIELICEDNTTILIAEGNPPSDALNEAKMTVVSEFSELSGEEGNSVMSEKLRKIYRYKAEIMGLSIALQTLPANVDESLDLIKQFGVRAKMNLSDEKGLEAYVKRVEAEIKNRVTRMNSEIKAYNNLSSKNEGKRITTEVIYEEMAVVSQYKNFVISEETNLAFYAACRKQFNHHLKALENGINKK